MFRLTFLVDDKHLAPVLTFLRGKSRELDIQPVINAKPARNGAVRPETYGNLPDLAMAEVRKQGLKEVNAKSMRTVVEYVGGNPNSYYHVIRNCIKHGELKKMPSKRGNVYIKYSVQPVKA